MLLSFQAHTHIHSHEVVELELELKSPPPTTQEDAGTTTTACNNGCDDNDSGLRINTAAVMSAGECVVCVAAGGDAFLAWWPLFKAVFVCFFYVEKVSCQLCVKS